MGKGTNSYLRSRFNLVFPVYSCTMSAYRHHADSFKLRCSGQCSAVVMLFLAIRLTLSSCNLCLSLHSSTGFIRIAQHQGDWSAVYLAVKCLVNNEDKTSSKDKIVISSPAAPCIGCHGPWNSSII
jgi:hypothetical protein